MKPIAFKIKKQQEKIHKIELKLALANIKLATLMVSELGIEIPESIKDAFQNRESKSAWEKRKEEMQKQRSASI